MDELCLARGRRAPQVEQCGRDSQAEVTQYENRGMSLRRNEERLPEAGKG